MKVQNLFGLPQKQSNKVHKIIEKVNSEKKAPPKRKVGSSNVAVAVKNAEDLALQKLSNYKDEYELITSPERLNEYLSLCEDGIVALDTETTGLNFYADKVVGICLHIKGQKACYVPTNHLHYLDNIPYENNVKTEDITRIFSKYVSKYKWIFHNAQFDVRMMIHNFNIDLIPYIYWDTREVSHAINENEDHGLKELHFKYCPTSKETEVVEFNTLFKGLNIGFVNPEIAMLYAAGDAIKTRELYEWQVKYLGQPGFEDLYKLVKEVDIPIIGVCCKLGERGIRVDMNFLNELKVTYKDQVDALQKEVYSELDKVKDKIENYRLAHKEDCKLSEPINLGSPTQLAILLYDILNLEKVEGRGTGADTLKRLRKKYSEKYGDFFSKFAQYRKINKLYTSFVVNIDKFIQADGKIHPHFNSRGALTSRMSCQDPNLQQIPSKDKTIRKMFIADDNEYIIGSDYSKQEVFLLAEACKDPKLIQVFIEGLDIYMKVESDVFDRDYWLCGEYFYDENHNKTREKNVEGEKLRSLCKALWLGKSYGLGAQGFADDVNLNKPEGEKELTVEEAEKYIKKLEETYSVMTAWEKDLIKKCKETGYVENLWKGRRHLPEIQLPRYQVKFLKDKNGEIVPPACFESDPFDWNLPEKRKYTLKDLPKSVIEKYSKLLGEKYISRARYEEIKHEARVVDKLDIQSNGAFIAQAERQCVNSCIQGSAAVLTKKALILIDRDPELARLGYKALIPVHDEILGTCPMENSDACSKRVAELMAEAGKGVVTSFPIKTDTAISKRWYGIEVSVEKLIENVLKNDIEPMDEVDEKGNHFEIRKSLNKLSFFLDGKELIHRDGPVDHDSIREFIYSDEFSKYIVIQD